MAQYPSEQPSSSSLKLSDTLDSKAQQLLDAKEGKSMAAAVDHEQILTFYRTIHAEMISINRAIHETMKQNPLEMEISPVEEKNRERIGGERSKALVLSKKVKASLNELFNGALPKNLEDFTRDIEALRHTLVELKQLKESVSNYLEMIKNLGDMATSRNDGIHKTPKQSLEGSWKKIESRLATQIYYLEKLSSPSLLVSLLNAKTSGPSDFRESYSQHIGRVNKLVKIYGKMQGLWEAVRQEMDANIRKGYSAGEHSGPLHGISVGLEMGPITQKYQESTRVIEKALSTLSPELYQDQGCKVVLREVRSLFGLCEKIKELDGNPNQVALRVLLDEIDEIGPIQFAWKNFSPERSPEQCKELGANLLQAYKKAKAEAKTSLLPYEFLMTRIQNPHIARDTLIGLTAIAGEAQGKLRGASEAVRHAYLKTEHELLHQYYQVAQILQPRYGLTELGASFLSSKYNMPEMRSYNSALQNAGDALIRGGLVGHFPFYQNNQERINEIHKNIINIEKEAHRENITTPIPSIPAVIFMCSPTTFSLSDAKSVSSNLAEASQALKQLIPIIMSYRDKFPGHQTAKGRSIYEGINTNFRKLHQLIAQCLFSWKMYSNELATNEKVDFEKVQRLTDQYNKVENYVHGIYKVIESLPFYPNHTLSASEKAIYDQMKSSFQKLLLHIWDLPNSYEKVLKEIEVVKPHIQKLVKATSAMLSDNAFSNWVANEVDKPLELLQKNLESSELSKIIPAKPENKKAEKMVESKLDAPSMPTEFQIQAQNAWIAFNFADEADKPRYLQVILSCVESLQRVAGRIDMLDPTLLAFLEKYSPDELAREIQRRGGDRYIHSEYLQDEKGARKKIDLNNLPKDFIRPMKIVSVLSKDLRTIPSVTPFMLKQLCILEVALLEQELENLYSKNASQERAGKLKEAFETQGAIVKIEETIEWLQLGVGPSKNVQDLLRVRGTLAQVYLNLRETKQGMPKFEYCQALDTLVSELKTEEDVIQKLKELENYDIDKLLWLSKKDSKNIVISDRLKRIDEHSLHVDLSSPFALFPSDIIALAESKGLQLSVATKDKAYVQEAENYRFKYEQYMLGKAKNPAFDQRVADKYRAAMNKALAAVQDITCLDETLHKKLKQFISEEEYYRRVKTPKIVPARALSLEIQALKLEVKAKNSSEKPEDIQSVIKNGQEISRKEKALRSFLMEIELQDPLTLDDRLWVGVTLAEQLDHDMSIPAYIRAKDHLRQIETAAERLNKLDEKINTSTKFKQLKEVIGALKSGKLKETLDNFQKIFENEKSVVRDVIRPSLFPPLDIIALVEHLGSEAKLEQGELEAAKKWAGELHQAREACRHWYEWREAKDAVKKQEHHAAMTEISETIKASVLYPKLQELFQGRLAPDIKATAKPVSSSSSSVPKTFDQVEILSGDGQFVPRVVDRRALNQGFPASGVIGTLWKSAGMMDNNKAPVSTPRPPVLDPPTKN